MRLPASGLLPFVLLAAVAAACTDRNPAGSAAAPAPEPPSSALSMLTCTVSMPAGTLSCAPEGAAAVASGSAAVLGGQGTNVRVASTGVNYDGTGTFRMDVTVENLTAQALGTADGTTPSPDGVRVFFASGPSVTEGTGAVAVANADGEAFFTGAEQPYFQYDGILPPGDTSAAREWRFSVPNTVVAFRFGVYVAGPVRAEGGWVSMSPIAPSLPVGDTMRITATMRNVAGGAGDGAVAWTTSANLIATVDAQGLVTGLAPGTAVITAAGGGRTGSVAVRVYAPGGTAHPTLHELRVPAERLVLEPGLPDSAHFDLAFSYPGLDSLAMRVTLRHPNGLERTCTATVAATLSEARCSIPFINAVRGGVWRIQRLELGERVMTHAALLAAGAPAYIYVENPGEDATPPTLFSFNLHPDTARAGEDVMRLEFGAGDDQVGLYRVFALLSNPGNPSIGCGSSPPGFSCGVLVPRHFRTGTWVVDSVWVEDNNRNRRTYRTAELEAAGYPVRMTVINSDTIPPTITAFSFSPLTVAGTGPDTVTVTLSAEEPLNQSGVWFLDMEFQKRSDESQRRRCLLNGATLVHSRTMTCKLAFGPDDEGVWWVRYVRAIDFANNSRELPYAEIAAAGWPVNLSVTGPEPDTIPPRITAFSFSPQTVAGNGADSITVTLSATEPAGEAGAWFMDVVLEKAADRSQYRWCQLTSPTPVGSQTMTCRQAFTAADVGEWRVRYIRAIDFMDNSRVLRTADLQAAGHPTQLTVTPP